MGGSHNREGLELSDSETEGEDQEEVEQQQQDQEDGDEQRKTTPFKSAEKSAGTPTLDDVEARLQSLKLKYASAATGAGSAAPNAARLYLHVGSRSPNAKWVVFEKITAYSFRKSSRSDGPSAFDDESDGEGSASWFLVVGAKVRARVDGGMQLKTFPEQRRVDFVAGGVWALKIFSDEAYKAFCSRYQSCLFENVHGMEANVAEGGGQRAAGRRGHVDGGRGEHHSGGRGGGRGEKLGIWRGEREWAEVK